MQERIWTVVRHGNDRWRVVDEARIIVDYPSKDEAVDAAVAAARKSVAALYPASVLIEEDGKVREIFPKRGRKPSQAVPRHPRSSGGETPPQGYDLVYFAAKFRIPMGTARRIIDRVGPDREKLNAAARPLKSR